MAFRDRFATIEEFDDWLIAFYEEKIIQFMDGAGEFTEYGTMISPALIKSTMRRYTELLDRKYDIDRKLQGETQRIRE
jgi:hypothetical protein|tara:strand:+ start:1428 stop:1661 length:234 start_codon:yes stop_codon:yes gene_type:complete